MTGQRFAELTPTANNPVARAGLQRAVVEHIDRELTSRQLAGDTDTEVLKSAQFQKFAGKSGKALSAIFSPEQVKAIHDVAADMQRSDLSNNATRVPNTSNTAHDTAASAKHGGHGQSVLGSLIAAEIVGEGVEHVAGPLGAPAKVATIVLSAMRQSGMQKVSDLRTEAMLHPELARALMAKYNAKAGPSQGLYIARLIKAAAADQAASAQVQRDQARAPLGPMPGLATPPGTRRFVPARVQAAH